MSLASLLTSIFFRRTNLRLLGSVYYLAFMRHDPVITRRTASGALIMLSRFSFPIRNPKNKIIREHNSSDESEDIEPISAVLLNLLNTCKDYKHVN